MDKFEKIVVLNNEVEAQLIDSVLSEHGIAHIMKSYYDSAYDGIFQVSKGWGHIEAPARYKEEIMAILKDLTSGSDTSEDKP
jgi:ketol-acid reductoisomerase